MKIVCDSCSTKYSISDDKVRGKVFKIRCKKCSHIIVVRGTGDAPAPAEVASDAVWHLVVEGDQVGPLTDVEVRARLTRGEISSENYVWKEGFSDWLRLLDVPEFADLGAAAPLGSELFPESAPAPSAKSGLHEAAPETSEEQPAFFGSAGGGVAHEVRASTRSSSGRMRTSAPAMAAAPEEDAFSLPIGTPARGNESADLFGMAPVAAQGDSGRAKSRGANGTAGAGRHDGGRVENLTGQRSENSVLFSLSNLQSLAAPAPGKTTGTQNTEGSGLIDIRAMAASTLKAPSASTGPLMFGGDSRAAADELPSYGAFSSAAPVLFPIPTASGPPKWLYVLIGLVVVVVIALGAAAFSILRKPLVEEAAAPPAPAPAAPAPAPAPAPLPAAAKTAVAEGDLPPRERVGGEAAGDEAGHDKGAGKLGGHHLKGMKKGGGFPGKGAAGDSRGESAGASGAPAAAAEPEKPKPQKGSLDDLLEGALSNRNRRARATEDDGSAKRGGGNSDSGGGGGPLAKSAVVAGMNGVKGKVAACYSQFKVPGMAMVNVVISKSGRVSSAAVTGKFAGTPTGGCVEAAVKSASFPPSDGLSTPYPFNLR